MDIRTVREIIQCGPMTTRAADAGLRARRDQPARRGRAGDRPARPLRPRAGRASARRPASSSSTPCATASASSSACWSTRSARSSRSPPTQIEPPPDFGTAVRRDFIRGMGKVGERFVILLEPDRAFDVDEMAQLCDAAQEAASA